MTKDADILGSDPLDAEHITGVFRELAISFLNRSVCKLAHLTVFGSRLKRSNDVFRGDAFGDVVHGTENISAAGHHCNPRGYASIQENKGGFKPDYTVEL